MLDPNELETTYNEFTKHLNTYAPDGVIDVNIELLQSLNLLDVELLDDPDLLPAYASQFYMVETEEKLTLFNQDFVVWIIPLITDESSQTYTLIASNTSYKPHLELVYSVTGVYNTSRLVLAVLNSFLQDIRETEELMIKIAH